MQELAVRGVLENSSGAIICGFASIQRVYFDFALALVLRIILAGNCFRSDTIDEPLQSMVRFGHLLALMMCQTLLACTSHWTTSDCA